MADIEGHARDQALLLPASVEDHVAADNPVRFIGAFADDLDPGGAGFQRTQPKPAGRPGYDPADMLKLYLYGYLDRVRSSRRLAAEATRNLEPIRLLRGVRPDFRTIADFRCDNRDAFKTVFREFVVLRRSLDLFGRGEDGAGTGRSDALATKIARLREQRQASAALMDQLEASGEGQISLTDPDARLMVAHSKITVGCNAQVAVRIATRLAKRPGIRVIRKSTVEHPFGSTKQWMNQGAFLMRGLDKVRAEFSLTALAYNHPYRRAGAHPGGTGLNRIAEHAVITPCTAGGMRLPAAQCTWRPGCRFLRQFAVRNPRSFHHQRVFGRSRWLLGHLK